MNQDLQHNLKDRSAWIRILYMLLFAFIYSIAEMVVFGVAILQIGFRLFTGQPHPQLVSFGEGLSQYVYQMLRFFTFASDTLPFPFGPWPGNGS